MNISYSRRMLMVVVMVVMSAASAYANDLTLYAGRVNPGELTLANVRTAFDGIGVYGFRLSKSFVPLVGLEHTIAFSPNFLRPSDFAATGDVRGFISNTNLVVNVPVGAVVPYATIGFGLIRTFGTDPILVSGTKFAVNYGGGLKFPNLAGPLGLRFDARGYTATGVFSNNLKIFEVSGGLIFSFGR